MAGELMKMAFKFLRNSKKKNKKNRKAVKGWKRQDDLSVKISEGIKTATKVNKKPVGEAAEVKGKRVEGAAEAKAKKVEGAAEAKGKKVEGAAEVKGKRVEGAAEAKGKKVEGAAEVKGKRVGGAAEAKGKKVEGAAEVKGKRVEGAGEAKGKKVEGAAEAKGKRVGGAAEAKGKRVGGAAEAKGKRVGGAAEVRNSEAEEENIKIKNLGKLFVGGLSPSTTEKELNAYFSNFGEVVDLSLPKLNNSDRSRGFAFVTYANPEDAETVLQVKSHVIDNEIVDIQAFSEKKKCPNLKKRKEKNIYLRSLPADTSEEKLRQFFSRYGELVDVSINRGDCANRLKSFGSLKFKDEEAVQKCLADRFVFLGGKRVSMDKANFGASSQSADDLRTCSTLGRNFDKAVEDTQSLDPGKELHHELKKLFEDNLEKSESFDATNEEKLNCESETWQSQDQAIKAKDLLDKFFMSPTENFASLPEDLTEFSSRSESDCETETDIASEINEDAVVFCDTTADDLEKTPEPLNAELPVESVDKSPSFSKKNSDPKRFRNNGELLHSENPSFLQFKNSKGFFTCSLCQWVSPNRSFETFAIHCKTLNHRKNLKERFLPESFRAKLNTLSIRANAQTEEDCSEPILISAKPSGVQVKENKNEIENGAEKEKANTDILSDDLALVQSLSESKLICKMCGKNVPKSSKPEFLMHHILSHLQSKMHVKSHWNIKNSSMRSSSPKSIPATGTENEASGSQNNPTAQNRRNDHVWKKKPHSTPASYAKNSQKETPEEKKIPAATGDSKDKFLCLICRTICENAEVFNVHLDLKYHTDSLDNLKTKANVSLAIMRKCKGCEAFLFGSLDYINKHYSECIGSKN